MPLGLGRVVAPLVVPVLPVRPVLVVPVLVERVLPVLPVFIEPLPELPVFIEFVVVVPPLFMLPVFVVPDDVELPLFMFDVEFVLRIMLALEFVLPLSVEQLPPSRPMHKIADNVNVLLIEIFSLCVGLV